MNSRIKDNIVCFLSSNHKLSATEKVGELIEDERLDGIPVYSLYKNEGSEKYPKCVPTEQFEDIDTLVVKLCDIGVLLRIYHMHAPCDRNKNFWLFLEEKFLSYRWF